MRESQFKDVEASLSDVVDQAVAGDPTVITRDGKKEAVVLSFAEYEVLSRRTPTFGEMLASFPGDAEDLQRIGGKLRNVDL